MHNIAHTHSNNTQCNVAHKLTDVALSCSCSPAHDWKKINGIKTIKKTIKEATSFYTRCFHAQKMSAS